jgi:hypothetical protein
MMVTEQVALETASVNEDFAQRTLVTLLEPVDLSYWPLHGETMRTIWEEKKLY